MAKRIIIGKRNGVNGVYISPPGKEVESTTAPLLLDSRYDMLRIHSIGSVRMSGYTYSGATTVGLYWATVTFPSLGYIPLVWGSCVFRNASAHGLPQNSAYYPQPWGGGNAILTGPRWSAFPAAVLKYFGYWVADNTTLRAKLSLDGAGGGFAIDFQYIIFENKR